MSNARPLQPLGGRLPVLQSDLGWAYDPANTVAPGPARWSAYYSSCGVASQSPVPLPAPDAALAQVRCCSRRDEG